MDETILLPIFQIIVLIYSVVLHEVAHGMAARSLGDDTAEQLGRLTLNPLVHLDMFGSFILPILSQVFAGFMFGYAKPVPYNPYRMRDRRYGPAKVAFAGPATNLALAALFGLLLRFGGEWFGPFGATLIGYVVLINLVLAFFNLIPVPPLDGHWLLMAALPGRFTDLKLALYRSQWILLILAIFVLFPAIIPLILKLFELLTGYAAF